MYFEYLLTKSNFFDSVDGHRHEPVWQTLLETRLGDDWLIHRAAFWLHCTPKHASALPEQGFKIHIAGDLRNAEAQLLATVAVLLKHRFHFKVIADYRLLEICNSKSFSRTGSGKFITIYPRDTASFCALATELSSALMQFNGPHILTDKLISGSKCVFYRYGAFKDLKTVSSGRIVHALRNNTGELIEDHRDPEFILPSWIEDPFTDEISVDDEDGLLGNRFLIQEAIHFSNSGGVYTAIDQQSGHTVIIKEARPHTATRRTPFGFADAQSVLRHEYDSLKTLETLSATPQPLALFSECGHLFLAQAKIDSSNWVEFFSRNETSLLPFLRGTCNVSGFLENFLPVMKSAIESLKIIHASGLILGDISANNILVNSETRKVIFIDLESAVAISKSPDSQRYLATPGFVRSGREAGSPIESEDDWYALGKCGLAAILPVQALSAVGSASDENLVRTLVYESGLPEAVEKMLLALLAAQPNEALACVDRCTINQCNETFAYTAANAEDSIPGITPGDIPAGVARFISKHYLGAAARMVWPGAPEGMQTNKWNIAYGAAGVASFLENSGHSLPDDLESALLTERPFINIYDAGLYTGLSGIAYWLATRRAYQQSLAVLNLARISPLRLRDPSVFSGEAGIGIAALSIYRISGASDALKLASECAAFLAETAIEHNDEHVSWANAGQPNKTYWGYSYGLAGIAFFLCQYGLACKDSGVLRIARRALDYLLSNTGLTCRGQIYISTHNKDNSRATYWANGSAGVGSVFLRVGIQLQDDRFIRAAKEFIDASFCKFGVQVGQLNGISGILESISDCAALCSDYKYDYLQSHMLEGLLIHRFVDAQGDIGSAGPANLRLACDFGTGAAGVGMAVLRAKGGSRPFFDFALPSTVLFRHNPSNPANGAPDGI